LTEDRDMPGYCPICHILTRPPPSNYQEKCSRKMGHIDRIWIKMSSDKSEDVSTNKTNDKCLNEVSLASGYKRMIYAILIVVLTILFLTAVLRWVSG